MSKRINLNEIFYLGSSIVRQKKGSKNSKLNFKKLEKLAKRQARAHQDTTTGFDSIISSNIATTFNRFA